MRHLLLSVLLVLCVPAEAVSARRETLRLHRVTLELPGPPASILSADLDGDGRKDLVVLVVYGEWIEIGEDRIEGLTFVTEVVPALIDRREIRVWLARGDGSYRALSTPLPLPTSVIAAEPGPAGSPVLLLTDTGLAALRLDPASQTLRIDPLIADRPAGSGASTLLPGKLGIVADLDGDGALDALLPTHDGPAAYLGGPAGLAPSPSARLRLPGDRRRAGRRPGRFYPLPRVEDVDGDRLPDLTVLGQDGEGRLRLHVLRGAGGGRFAAPVEVDLEAVAVRPIPGAPEKGSDARPPDGLREMAWFGDLDGDGRAELVTREEIDTGKSDLKQAKRPTLRYRFHRLQALAPEPAPYRTVQVIGHAFDHQGETFAVASFQDLDGDGRKDLVTVTLDFSVLQALKILATKSMTLGLEFHVYRHAEDGDFVEVPGLDLSEKLKIDLNDLRVGRFAQFSGDFDGDGRADFAHLGRGKVVTLHRGREGAHYPEDPDLSIPLGAPIEDLAQVRIEDLDGDGRADLAIARPGRSDEPGVLPPVVLDLHLTGGGAGGEAP